MWGDSISDPNGYQHLSTLITSTAPYVSVHAAISDRHHEAMLSFSMQGEMWSPGVLPKTKLVTFTQFSFTKVRKGHS